jgi:hypothetical protein
MLKMKERKRLMEVKTYLFGGDPERSGSAFSPGCAISHDSGIDDLDGFGIPGTAGSRISSTSQTDINGSIKDPVERTRSDASESDSSQFRMFVTSDTDSDLGSEGYQV